MATHNEDNGYRPARFVAESSGIGLAELPEGGHAIYVPVPADDLCQVLELADLEVDDGESVGFGILVMLVTRPVVSDLGVWLRHVAAECARRGF